MTDAETVSPAHRDDATAGRSRRRGFWLFLRDTLIIILIAIVVSSLIKTFLVRTFYIPSSSMENTLQINDRILVNQLTPRFYGLDHGDIVVFRDPGGWLGSTSAPTSSNPVAQAWDWMLNAIGIGASDSDEHLVKRVIGMSGDHVVCCNGAGQIVINGVPINETPYLKLPEGTTRASDVDFDVTVPEGSLWVMGDNRYNSRDSRGHMDSPGGGFVPVDSVVGEAFVVSWPFSRFAWLGNYPQVFGGVPPPESSDS